MTQESELNEYEIDVLRILNGEDVPGWSWGGAMSVCCDYLKGQGYAGGMYHITEKGKKYLEEIYNAE